MTAPDDNFDVQKGRIQTRWFVGGTTNLCYNAVDRHVKDGKGDKVAFYWEGNDVGEDSKMTYSEVPPLRLLRGVLRSVQRVVEHVEHVIKEFCPVQVRRVL